MEQKFVYTRHELTKYINFPLSQRLCADDFSVSPSFPNPRRAARLLQMTLNKISTWSSEGGFRFSDIKTVMKIILTSSSLLVFVSSEFPDQSSTLCKISQFSFRSWTSHIKITRSKCLSSLNTLEYLSHIRTGCNRELLLELYNSSFRSPLDYGAPILSYAYESSLKLLDSNQSSVLRMALGTLRSSPTLSLYAEAGELPLRYRFLFLSLIHI